MPSADSDGPGRAGRSLAPPPSTGTQSPPPGTGAGGDAAAGFRKVAEETLFEGVVFNVSHGTFVAPDGTSFERYVVRHPGAVAVVAVTGEGSVVLLRQYRPSVDRWILEIPAGTRDVDDEPAVETARRELAEEAGYEAGQMELLAEILNTPGFCDEATGIYLATGLTAVPPRRHGVEEQQISVEEIDLDRFDDLVDDGSITDAQTIVGVALARRRLAARDARSGRG
ncbi:MAG TPA: NUDIX hydrolase [Acidimicrobiales bacterium]|nr:NUDIX hydrolase [Acidimicrobiales bacterium]